MEQNFKQQLMKYMTGNFSCREIAELITDYLAAIQMGTMDLR